MANPQLKLVQDTAQDLNTGSSADITRRLFDHWLYMLGRSPRRCKLGPTRRAAINAALAMGYDEDTLLLTLEGIAADPLDGKPETMRAAMRELEWLLARESRIEHWAEIGEALRADAQHQASQALRPAAPVAEDDPAAAAAARERLFKAAKLRREAAHG